MLGSGGGGSGEHTQKINFKTLNETPNAKSQQFSKINWACAVTLNSFVGFGKCVFDRQLCTNIFEKSYYQYFSFETVHGEAMLKTGWVEKKWNFSLLNGIKLVKMLMVSLYIWISIFTNNETLCIIWNFDLSLRGVLGRIYALSIEVLYVFPYGKIIKRISYKFIFCVKSSWYGRVHMYGY